MSRLHLGLSPNLLYAHGSGDEEEDPGRDEEHDLEGGHAERHAAAARAWQEEGVGEEGDVVTNAVCLYLQARPATMSTAGAGV